MSSNTRTRERARIISPGWILVDNESVFVITSVRGIGSEEDRSLLTPCISSSEDCALPSFCGREAGRCTDGMAPPTCPEHRAKLRACSPSPQTTPQVISAPRKTCQRYSHDPSTTVSRGNMRGSSSGPEPPLRCDLWKILHSCLHSIGVRIIIHRDAT